MKILYLIHQFYPAHHGGTEKYVLQLAKQAQVQGHDVKVVTYDAGNRQPMSRRPAFEGLRGRVRKRAAALLRRMGLLNIGRRIAALKKEPIQYYEDVYEGVPVLGYRAVQLDRMHFSLSDPNLTAFAEEILEREAPDLIHAAYLARTAEFLHVAQRLRIPYLIAMTSFWLICPKSNLVNEKGGLCAGPRGGAECKVGCPSYTEQEISVRNADMQRLLGHVAAVVAPSRYMARIAQREVGNVQVMHIPYGIEYGIEYGVERQRVASDPQAYPPGRSFVFFFGGRLAEEKGVRLLLTAFRHISAQQIRLRIFGDGELRPEVLRAAQADPRIEYGGVYNHDQSVELLRQADVVVIPSVWHENLPMIMLEAQACGVPTLVADVGGMTECVTDGVNGFTFHVGNVSDLQRVMQQIIDHPERFNAIRENMRRPGPGQYRVVPIEEVGREYMALYHAVVDRNQSTGRDSGLLPGIQVRGVE